MLGLEGCNGSNDSRCAGKLSWYDAGCLYSRPKCAAPNFGAQRSKERLASRSNAAGDDDRVRIEDVEQARDPRS
jgi:hypothetical protein